MKNHILLFLSLWSIVPIADGQVVEGKEFNKKGYQAWVLVEGTSEVHGLLWKMDSLSLFIKSDQIKNWKNPASEARIFEIPIERIQSIRIKRVHAVWKGYGYGVLTGITVGSIGALVYQQIEPDDGSILLIPMGGFIGSAVGIIAGNFPGKTFQIDGNENLWRTIMPEIQEKAFWIEPKKR